MSTFASHVTVAGARHSPPCGDHVGDPSSKCGERGEPGAGGSRACCLVPGTWPCASQKRAKVQARSKRGNGRPLCRLHAGAQCYHNSFIYPDVSIKNSDPYSPGSPPPVSDTTSEPHDAQPSSREGASSQPFAAAIAAAAAKPSAYQIPVKRAARRHPTDAAFTEWVMPFERKLGGSIILGACSLAHSSSSRSHKASCCTHHPSARHHRTSLSMSSLLDEALTLRHVSLKWPVKM